MNTDIKAVFSDRDAKGHVSQRTFRFRVSESIYVTDDGGVSSDVTFVAFSRCLDGKIKSFRYVEFSGFSRGDAAKQFGKFLRFVKGEKTVKFNEPAATPESEVMAELARRNARREERRACRRAKRESELDRARLRRERRESIAAGENLYAKQAF